MMTATATLAAILTAATSRAVDSMAREIVAQDVRYCVSSLIHGLSRTASSMTTEMLTTIGIDYEDFYGLAYRQPDADDFRDAADSEGLSIEIQRQATDAGGSYHWSLPSYADEGRATTEVEAWRAAFDAADLEYPNGAEVYEHWLVTDDLARRLRDAGETVADDVAGMTVWGRATTGQAIYGDDVIQRIARDILEA